MRPKPNKGIENLSAYQLADLSVPADCELISLSQNELCFAPSTSVIEAGLNAAEDANHYPDPDWTALTQAIARVHSINRHQIICGAGSMELLELLGRIYLSSNDSIVMSEYGYAFFKTVAHMYEARIDIAREVNFTVNIDNLLEQVQADTKIVFVANPGNPTGTAIPATQIRTLRSELPDHVLLIIDEAYAEFANTKIHSNLFDLVELDNTVILRTFSKIYGLAGMRVGWGYFPSALYNLMRKVLNPNNISAVSQACATQAMNEQDEMRQRKNQLDLIRSRFTTAVTRMGFQTPDSQGNFVLINFNTAAMADAAFLALRNSGIILRPMKSYGLDQCLRATLSTQQNMDKTVAVMETFTTEQLR